MSLFRPNPGLALEYLPAHHDLSSLKDAAAQCHGCDLYRRPTQVVFGEVIVCLRATAAQDLLGPQFRRTKHRGEVLPTQYGPVTATIHPSAILRMPPPETKEVETASLVSLQVAVQYVSARRAK